MDPNVIALEAAKLAVSMAKDLSVQLLTLASAMIGLTVVLSKDIKKTHNLPELCIVALILFAYLISMLSGVFTLMRLTGVLAPLSGQAPSLSIDLARTPAGSQIVAFLSGTALFALYGVIAITMLWRKQDEPQVADSKEAAGPK